MFLPFRPRHTLRDVADQPARVLVIFHDPEAGARLSSNVVARLHGLTPSEARLAVALAAGDSLTQGAANVGCTDQTCRTHLKHILEKTGTHRQAELVHLFLGNVAIQMASADGVVPGGLAAEKAQ
jgi:DNA-binding CsgD family transcriptional regulator